MFYTAWKMRLPAADCGLASGGVVPGLPPGLCPYTPLGDEIPRPSVPTLPPDSGYATGVDEFGGLEGVRVKERTRRSSLAAYIPTRNLSPDLTFYVDWTPLATQLDPDHWSRRPATPHCD